MHVEMTSNEVTTRAAEVFSFTTSKDVSSSSSSVCEMEFGNDEVSSCENPWCLTLFLRQCRVFQVFAVRDEQVARPSSSQSRVTKLVESCLI